MMEHTVCIHLDLTSIAVGCRLYLVSCPGLRITKDTELGSNETIKNPAPMEIPPRRGKRCSGSSNV